MGSRFTELIVDAADPRAIARFWEQVLGWVRTVDEPDEVEIAPPGGAKPTIVFVPVPEAKTVKNRLHIDVNPVGCTRDEEVDRLLALGARRVDVGQGDHTWVVLADPEGNEFCVLGTTVDA
jgi:hypothetical protein